ncbi:MAG: DUF4377 domain-containing protein [Rhodanobacter sp.]
MKYSLLVLSLALAACSTTPTSNASSTSPAPTAAQPTSATDTAMLSQYHWQLSAANDSAGQRIDALFAKPDKPLQLNFTNGRVSVSNACNMIGGPYTIQDGRLQMRQMMHTMMMCADPARMRMDSAISERLQSHPTLSLVTNGDAPQLRLVTDSGDTLVFVGQPTAETRYGGPGEKEFLEVAAQTIACNHPLIPNMQCLQVRELTYDQNGLRTGTPGEWHPLYQSIEGYTHEQGVRNVLRVKRFTIKNPPADAPSSAYVLDMVVESELVKH